ncbi:isopenicillin N synthase family oxygenase [Jannaschia sp. Os4]|uniref:isopenicillin N synthase family dioxygenase n=1 Tax=Jannaschia sp. Os4 TaxID=2807617 RepID=UPI0019395C39|nr:isopenicillin N synthase family oxygenase [Jannaschia sp. Os4]MBM2578097.1 isopenicillin N synthase family oxygenase [Jannaschia sp. Os4]
MEHRTLGLPSCASGIPPLIDVGDLRSGDAARRRAVGDRIGRAAREVGFFRIAGHGIAPATIEGAYAAAARFFARPDADKRRWYIGDSPNHRGYVPFTEKGDYPDEVHRSYEAFDLGHEGRADDPLFRAGRLLCGPNLWPDDDPAFRAAVSAYHAGVAALGRDLCTLLEEHLGVRPGAITDRMRRPISQLRLLHYVRGAATRDAQSVNMGAHTDYECLTLLHTRNPGLQVLTQDGRWIDVPVDPRVLVVNIGDMLEALTGGAFRSTPHRVLNLKPERFSMPYFVAADHDAEIAPLDGLGGPAAAARYPAFTAGAHLERMLRRDFPYLRARAGGAPGGDAVTNPFEDRIRAAAATGGGGGD